MIEAVRRRAGDEFINRNAIASDPQPAQVPPFMMVTIRRDGDRVRATIEPVEIRRADSPEPVQIRRKAAPVRDRTATPAP